MKKYFNKYVRAGLIGGIGIIFAITAAILTTHTIDNQVHTQNVVVLKEDILPFKAITKEKLTYQEIPISTVPEDAVTNHKELQLTDLYATEYGFAKGSPLRKTYTSTKEHSKMGTSISLPKGKLEIGVATNLIQSAGDAIKSGVYVDVCAWVRKENSDAQHVITPKENPKMKHILVKKRLNTQGKIPDEGDSGGLIPAVAILEVTPEQATDLVKYQETGKVYLLPSGT